MRVDPGLVVPDPALSLREGAVACWPDLATGWARHKLDALSQYYGFGLMTPFRDLDPHVQDVLLKGSGDEKIEYRIEFEKGRWEYTGGFEGAAPNLERRYRETQSENIRRWIEGFMAVDVCPACHGARLKPEALAVKVGGLSIDKVSAQSVKQCAQFFRDLGLKGTQKKIAEEILKEIDARLGFLADVGLDYLTLDRSSGTLSGGEAQRIRLATQIGTRLVGVLYILDEPSIGLHQYDNAKLLRTLTALRDIGNTVIVVEHDEETIRAADWVVDLGPGAGREGGYVVASCPPGELAAQARVDHGPVPLRQEADRASPEEAHARPRSAPRHRRQGEQPHRHLRRGPARDLHVRDRRVRVRQEHARVRHHLPRPRGVVLPGAEGARQLRPHRGDRAHRQGRQHQPGPDRADAAVEPGDVHGHVRAHPPAPGQGAGGEGEGLPPGRFSFNVRGGRCEACQGGGEVKIEMHFLPDVFVTCEACGGKRFNRETLDVHYKGKNIAEILEMTVDEGLEFFGSVPMIKRKLKTLREVGLGYIHLGQSATTLSGGEAQRIKLATELSRRSTGKTLYILDEPTTGLHIHDVKMLLDVLGRLVERGNTVLVIEHNMDVIKTADHIIDLGPKGGDEGGRVVVTGTPEVVARCDDSYTGRVLKGVLERDTRSPRGGGRACPESVGPTSARGASTTVTTRRRWRACSSFRSSRSTASRLRVGAFSTSGAATVGARRPSRKRAPAVWGSTSATSGGCPVRVWTSGRRTSSTRRSPSPCVAGSTSSCCAT